MENFLIIVSLLVILGFAVRYVYKAKKANKCVGCPCGGNCSKKCR